MHFISQFFAPIQRYLVTTKSFIAKITPTQKKVHRKRTCENFGCLDKQRSFIPTKYEELSHRIDWYNSELFSSPPFRLRHCHGDTSQCSLIIRPLVMSGWCQGCHGKPKISTRSQMRERAGAVTSWSILTPGITAVMLVMIWWMFVISSVVIMERRGNWLKVLEAPQM